MINVECRTNIDSCRSVRFPKEMLTVPRIGDKVRSIGKAVIRGKNQIREIEQLEMYVVGVVFGSRIKYGYGGVEVGTEPYVEIELHTPHAEALGLL